MSIQKYISKANSMEDCVVLQKSNLPSISDEYKLPDDLVQFYSKCGGMSLFEDYENAVRIVTPSEFVNANSKLFDNEIIQGEIEKGTYLNEISRHWFIVADLYNSNYIVIDLSEERYGLCYTAFHELYPEVDSCTIIARSFTELLECFVYGDNQSDCFYFEENYFEPYGDAYDDVSIINEKIKKRS